MSKLRVAVVGLGIGQAHLKAYSELPDQYEIFAVCDLDASRAQTVAAEVGGARSLTSFDELLALDEVDVVDLCTPSFLHAQQAAAALAAGKHVICEKPLTSSLAELARLGEIERKSGKRLMPIYQKRFGNGAAKLLYLRERGLTGRAYLSTVETHWRRRDAYYAVDWRGTWRGELGGSLVTHAIHAHDLLTYVVGPVKSVFARTKTLVNPIEAEDCAAVSLEMADGSLATLAVTLGSSKEITRHRFCFANLVAESNTVPYDNTSDPWQFYGDTPGVDEQIEAALAEFTPQREQYAAQFAGFYEALQSGGEPPVTLADAHVSLELIAAIYHSSRTGQPVDLPLDRGVAEYEDWLPT